MMTMTQGSKQARPTDVSRLIKCVSKHLGNPASWSQWPGGWPDDIEAALVDAVFSARARYETKAGRGIHSQVVRWRQSRSRGTFTLEALAKEISTAGPADWAAAFGNLQHSPRRRLSAPGGPLKAATVLEAANALVAIGVSRPSELTCKNLPRVKATLCSVSGVGYATANYFLMLLGRPGVKPDRMVHRFLARAIGQPVSNAQADALVTAAARSLNVPTHELDHAMWRYERAHQASPGGLGLHP